MVEVVVARLGLDATNQAFVVLLQERGGDRVLPIWIGRAEADAIAAHLQGVPRARPMTHDLAATLVTGLGGTLRRVQVTHVHQGTFYAELHVVAAGGPTLIDARPSDAIALALRLDAPIFVAEGLLGGEDGEPTPGDELPPPDDDAEVRRHLQRHLEQLRPEDFGRFRP